MELLFNDLSLHGQFRSARDFEESIGRVMEMREIARSFGRDVSCPRSALFAPRVVGDMPMRQAINSLGRSAQSALTAWLTREGPFIEDTRRHRGFDYLAFGDEDEVVTDTAVGEAAYCRTYGEDIRLVSLSPSTWNFSPVPVVWHKPRRRYVAVDIENYWERESLQRSLESAPAPMKTWRGLEEVVRMRYAALTFSDDAFEPILHNPFVPGAAKKINQILGVLHELKHSFDGQGRLTNEGQELWRKHFTGDKALFSDSSEKEKAQFETELTFRNPSNPNERLPCTWHGKVKTPQIRVHYYWNMSEDAPVYVVYVGPKITKR